MISVFVPTYNSALYIRETLDCLMSQTYGDIEILVVDDSSKDETPNVVRQIAERDKRVRLFCKPNEGSVPFSWRYIMPEIRGEFVLYMSHDDLLLPDTVEKLVKKIDPDTDCVIPQVVFFEKDLHSPEAKFDGINQQYQLSGHPDVSGEKAFAEMVDYTIPGFALWRTAMIRKCGMRTESFNSDELMQRLWVKASRKVKFSEGVFGYRQSPDSIVRGIKPAHLFSLDTNLQLYRAAMDSPYIPVGKLRELQLKYFKALLYLSRYHKKVKPTLQSDTNDRIERLKTESYRTLKSGLKLPYSHKGLYYRLIILAPSIAGIKR